MRYNICFIEIWFNIMSANNLYINIDEIEMKNLGLKILVTN